MPQTVDDYQQVFHFPPVRQFATNTCWCFAVTSFIESEVYRLTRQKVKLSEMYTVYFEYLEKARRFVGEHGDSFFGEESEANTVFLVWKKYGIVPASVYQGEGTLEGGRDHRSLLNSMSKYLRDVKNRDDWDEEFVLDSIRSILDNHLGAPPVSFNYEGREMSPRVFLEDVLQINIEDYVTLVSFSSKPFYECVGYDVEANWWLSKDYYNVPLDVFYTVIKRSVRNGFSVELNGDVSEPGFLPDKDAAIVPPYDVPAESIDQSAREIRFRNKHTSDDHDFHLVGYAELEGFDWFLIKDSADFGLKGKMPGYWCSREDYIKLKVLCCTVHQDAAKAVIGDF